MCVYFVWEKIEEKTPPRLLLWSTAGTATNVRACLQCVYWRREPNWLADTLCSTAIINNHLAKLELLC